MVVSLICIFSLWCIHWVGNLYAGRIFMFVCIESYIWTQGGWLAVGCIRPPGCLFYCKFWSGGPGVSLTLCCFVVYSTRRFVLCLALCCFVLECFSHFSVTIASLGEGAGAGLGAFRTFVRFALVFFSFLFLLVSGKICGLWLWHSLDFSLTLFFGNCSYLHIFIWRRLFALRLSNTAASILNRAVVVRITSNFRSSLYK